MSPVDIGATGAEQNAQSGRPLWGFRNAYMSIAPTRYFAETAIYRKIKNELTRIYLDIKTISNINLLNNQ